MLVIHNQQIYSFGSATARMDQALDAESPAQPQASVLTPRKSLSGFVPLYPLPMLPAKSIKALIPLTNFSWKRNPIDTTESGG